MKKLEKILIPTDFSPFAQTATEVGISLAKKFDSSLTFLHVVKPTPYSSLGRAFERHAEERFKELQAEEPFKEVQEQLEREEVNFERYAEEHFKKLQEQPEQEKVNVDKSIVVRGRPVDEILKTAEERALKRYEARFKELQEQLEREEVNFDKFIVIYGRPADEILKTAEHNNFNLIVMGACGGEKRLIEGLGGTAERVIRKSEKPVLTVRPPAADIFEHILAPVDFSNASEHALRNAIRLTRAFRSQLTILHVIEDVKEYLYADTDEDAQNIQKQWEREANNRFDKFLEPADLHDLEWKRMVRTGKPHEEIEKIAREVHADLIVMGARGQEGVIHQFLMGTTATKVCKILPASLLTVKEEDILRVSLAEDIDDIETLYKAGLGLLEDGLLEDAISHLEHLLRHDMHFAPAWDAMARAYERLKQPQKAETCRERAELIRQRLWSQTVEA